MKPLYEQIAELIKLQIRNGEFSHGEKIETENQLCARYGVSRVTVRSAINLLCDEGLLHKKQGLGTFVTLPEEMESHAPAIQGSFSAYCLERRQKPHSIILKQELIPSPDAIAKILGVEPDEDVIYLRRLRLIDDVPVIYEEDYLNTKYRLLLSAELTDRSLFDFINSVYHTLPKHFEDEFYISNAPEDIAELLNIPVDSPVLTVDQTVFDENHNTLLFNRQQVNSNLYRYHVFSYANEADRKSEAKSK